MMFGRERICEYDIFDQYASNCLSLLAVLKFFFIKTHPFHSDFVSEVMVQNRKQSLSVNAMQFDYQNTVKQNPLCQLIIMCKTVKCKIKISVRIWVCMMSSELG